MIDDELHRAARDLRRQVDTLVPPPIKSGANFGGRMLLVAASVAVFAGGGLLVATQFDDSSNEIDRSPATQITDEVISDVTEDGDPTETIERPTTAPLPESLIGDTAHRPASPLSRPQFGAPSIEPEFSTPIVAITETGTDEAIVPVPGGAPSWNADGSLLMLYEITEDWRGHALYDGQSFERIQGLDFEPVDIEQLYWDPSDPDRMFYISEVEAGPDDSRFSLMAHSVDAGSSTAVHNFVGCDDVSSKDVARPISDDGRLLGFLCRSGDVTELVAVDLGSDTDLRGPAAQGDIGPIPTPTGDGFVVISDDGVLRMLDSDLEPTGISFAVGTDMFLLIATDDGRQLLVTTVFGEPADAIGSVVAFDLATGETRVAVGEQNGFPYPPSGTRLATSAGGNGLVAVAITGQTEPGRQATLDGEVLLVDFNRAAPVVGRLGHHRATGVGQTIDEYFTTSSPAVDPTGRRVLFSSNWGEDRVDTFMVDIDPATLDSADGE